MEEDDEIVHMPIEEALDLHAFAPRDIPAVVEDYLEAAHAAGFRLVRLIHGRGIGAQRGVVHRLLRSHPMVEEFWDAPESRLGATMAKLRDSPRS